MLYNFKGGHDGEGPYGGVIRDSKGNLYGTTQEPNFGLVFKLDPSGNETVLYTFQPGTDGEFPMTDLTRDSKGNLYGTTYHGGLYGFGTVFKLDKKGHETVLYNFLHGPDGSDPLAGLARDSAGNLYGTTDDGGDGSNSGVVFKLTP